MTSPTDTSHALAAEAAEATVIEGTAMESAAPDISEPPPDLIAPPMTAEEFRGRIEKGFQLRGLDIPEISEAQVEAFMAEGLSPTEAFDTLTA